jgi:hypothetical protein
MKIYLVAVKALGQKERHDETLFPTNIGGKISLHPSYFAF